MSEANLSPSDKSAVEQLTVRHHQLRYYPRLIYDIKYNEFVHGIPIPRSEAAFRAASDGVRAAIARAWCPESPDTVLVALSVRTFFDRLLTVLNLPKGSEVLFSAVSIPHMVDVVEHHGLKATSFDIDFIHFRADVEQARQRITPRTKVMIMAPLFGRPMEGVQELCQLAREHNILTIMDGAQSFSIRHIFEQYPADIHMVSFGSIKFATALGGCIATIKDRTLAAKVQAAEAELPTRSSSLHYKNVLKYAFLLLSDDPISFGLCRSAVEFGGGHIGEFVNKASRGFPGDMLKGIRHRPHYGMLKLLLHRVTHIDVERRHRVCQSAWDILRQLPPYVQVVAAGDPKVPTESTFWLFTMIVSDPTSCAAALQANGFDAALGTSQMRAVQAQTATKSDLMIRHVLYVPVYPEMGEEKRRELLSLIHRLPEAVVRSPSADFHTYVASLPLRHAYRSEQVDLLLNGRKPFQELPCQVLYAAALAPLGMFFSGAAFAMAKL